MKSLVNTEIDKAMTLAMELSDTHVWDEVVTIFKNARPAYECSSCGGETGAFFNPRSLKWKKTADICETCRNSQKSITMKKEVRIQVDVFIKEIDSHLSNRGVSKRFIGASINDFPDAYKTLIKSERGIFFTGPRGTGKTHLAVALMREECYEITKKAINDCETLQPGVYPNFARSIPVMVSIPELLLEIRQSFNDKANSSEKEIIDRYTSVPFLVLDDMGAEKTTEWSMQTLFVIIDRRYRDIKKTIITSNLSLKEISDTIGDRIASRISEMCDVKIIKGEDRRVKR